MLSDFCIDRLDLLYNNTVDTYLLSFFPATLGTSLAIVSDNGQKEKCDTYDDVCVFICGEQDN